jgi:hypothetical protein
MILEKGEMQESQVRTLRGGWDVRRCRAVGISDLSAAVVVIVLRECFHSPLVRLKDSWLTRRPLPKFRCRTVKDARTTRKALSVATRPVHDPR